MDRKGSVERRMEEKIEDEKRLEEKRRQMLEKGGVIVTAKQQEHDESSIRRIMKIDPFGSFRKGDKKPPPVEIAEIGLKGANVEEMKLGDALDEARKMKEEGASPKSPVRIITGDGHREQHTTLQELLRPKTKTRLEKDFRSGGLIILGGDGDSGGGGFKPEEAASTLLKTAGVIAQEWYENYREDERRRNETGSVVKDIIGAVKAVIFGGDELDTRAGMGGGDSTQGRALKAFKGPTWYQMDETSKFGALWWYDNMRFRGQYAYIGKWIGHPWGFKEWTKRQKKWSKKKDKYTKTEKLLDIFFINIEDVFEVDKLTAQEVYDLEDYDKKHPTEKQYMALKKLMKEEGYVEERQFISAVEVAKSFQPSDVYVPR